MEDSNNSNKETEFNSSIATLKRIDDLMRQLHDLARGLIPMNKFGYPLITGNPHQLYLDTTERLLLEGREKFTEIELNILSLDEMDLICIKEQYSNNLYQSKVSKGVPSHEYVNPLYYEGWNKLLEANKKYERHIISFLDKHGMLLKDKDDSSYALR